MRVRLRLAWRSTYVTTVVPGLMRTGSHLNAEFKRQDRKEFLWFSLGATLPMSSISAADAARQIVAAIERGDAEVILTWQAKLLALVHALAPGPISDILQLVNRVLPEPGPGEDALQSATGHQSQTALTQSRLEVLGHKAARDLNQLR